MENEIENLINKAYRDYMAAELARPEIAADKQKLAAFFTAPSAAPAPAFGIGAAAFVPALLLIGIFFVMNTVQMKAPEVAGPSLPIYRGFETYIEDQRAKQKTSEDGVSSEAASLYRPIDADDPVRNHMKPRVVVKRVSSRVGPTLVYQKTYRNTPVTIVWVFNRPLSTPQRAGGGI